MKRRGAKRHTEGGTSVAPRSVRQKQHTQPKIHTPSSSTLFAALPSDLIGVIASWCCIKDVNNLLQLCTHWKTTLATKHLNLSLRYSTKSLVRAFWDSALSKHVKHLEIIQEEKPAWIEHHYVDPRQVQLELANYLRVIDSRVSWLTSLTLRCTPPYFQAPWCGFDFPKCLTTFSLVLPKRVIAANSDDMRRLLDIIGHASNLTSVSFRHVAYIVELGNELDLSPLSRLTKLTTLHLGVRMLYPAHARVIHGISTLRDVAIYRMGDEFAKELVLLSTTKPILWNTFSWSPDHDQVELATSISHAVPYVTDLHLFGETRTIEYLTAFNLQLKTLKLEVAGTTINIFTAPNLLSYVSHFTHLRMLSLDNPGGASLYRTELSSANLAACLRKMTQLVDLRLSHMNRVDDLIFLSSCSATLENLVLQDMHVVQSKSNMNALMTLHRVTSMTLIRVFPADVTGANVARLRSLYRLARLCVKV